MTSELEVNQAHRTADAATCFTEACGAFEAAAVEATIARGIADKEFNIAFIGGPRLAPGAKPPTDKLREVHAKLVAADARVTAELCEVKTTVAKRALDYLVTHGGVIVLLLAVLAVGCGGKSPTAPDTTPEGLAVEPTTSDPWKPLDTE